MNKVTIRYETKAKNQRQRRNKGKAKNHALSDYLTQASLFVKKNLMMKIILRKALLTFKTMRSTICVLHSENFFSQILN